MKRLLSTLPVVALLAACGGNPVAEVEKITEEACACKDMPCVEAALKRAEKLGEKYRNETPSESEKAQMMAASTRMIDCITKLQAGEAAPAAPPAAAPPAAGDEAGDEAADEAGDPTEPGEAADDAP